MRKNVAISIKLALKFLSIEDPNDLAIVKSINEVARTEGKKTIAEFAENNEILESLSDIGVGFAQGFSIDHPRSIEEIGSIIPGWFLETEVDCCLSSLWFSVLPVVVVFWPVNHVKIDF